MPTYLDEYIRTMHERAPAQRASEVRWLQGYYFDHNDDSPRKERLLARLAELAAAGPSPPPVRTPRSPESGGTGSRP